MKDHKHLDIEVSIASDETLKAGARQVVANIRPEWKKVDYKIFREERNQDRNIVANMQYTYSVREKIVH